MGHIIGLVATIVALLAVFFTLESFAPVRSRIRQRLPDPVVDFFQEVHSAILPLFSNQNRLLTKEELAKYTGETSESEGAIYLGILGSVFDVTKGKKHYGPGGGYSFFAGRDGSRAFVTGDFTDSGLTDDVTGFTNEQILSLEEWKEFYSKDYSYVGKIVGRFFDSEGKPTEASSQYHLSLQTALADKKAEKALMLIFPSCNSKWSQGGQTHVWCTNRSGGIKRDWVGVPRQYFQAGKSQPRCACVRANGSPYDAKKTDSHTNRGDLDNPNLKEYEECDAKADTCVVKSENK